MDHTRYDESPGNEALQDMRRQMAEQRDRIQAGG